MAQKTARNGVGTVYAYDIHGRLLSQTAGGDVISYTYDGNGNQLTMTDSTGTTTRVYDALNRVTSKTAPDTGTMTFGYDVTVGMTEGHTGETSTDSKGNVTTKIYDKAGRLVQVKNGNTVAATYKYNDNGSLQKLTYAGGAAEEYVYYDNNKLKTLTNKHANGTTIDAYHYWYDGNGNMVEKLDGSGTTVYLHDKLNRLTKVAEPDGTVTEYTYDGSGNRKTETVTKNSQTTTTTYAYDRQNRLTGTEEVRPNGVEKTVTFAYDHNGNLISRITETLSPKDMQTPAPSLGFGGEAAVYEYDVWNNMTKAVVTGDPRTIVTTNTYNGDGLRVSKTVDSLTTRYAYEYNEIVLELDGNGSQTTVNLRGLKLISRTSGQAATYFMYNGQGDVTALTDGGNVLKASYDYDAFGVHKSQTGEVNNPYRYRGYQFDQETGLYYLKARFYDPVTSRMLSEDTVRGDPKDPLSLNLYTYCGNNPVLWL